MRVSQRLAYATAAALAAFVLMVAGAVLTYVALTRSPGVSAFSAANAPVAASAQAQAPTPAAIDGVQAPPAPDGFQAPQSQQPSTQNGGSDQGSAYAVSPDQAATIALDASPGSSLAGEPRLVSLGGAVAYLVPLDTGYVFVDAGTGQVLQSGRGRDGLRHRTRGQTP